MPGAEEVPSGDDAERRRSGPPPPVPTPTDVKMAPMSSPGVIVGVTPAAFKRRMCSAAALAALEVTSPDVKRRGGSTFDGDDFFFFFFLQSRQAACVNWRTLSTHSIRSMGDAPEVVVSLSIAVSSAAMAVSTELHGGRTGTAALL